MALAAGFVSQRNDARMFAARGFQSLCDNPPKFARVVASAREGKPVEAWAFRPSKKRAKTQGFSPGGSALSCLP